jgi:hypothetical protein
MRRYLIAAGLVVAGLSIICIGGAIVFAALLPNIDPYDFDTPPPEYLTQSARNRNLTPSPPPVTLSGPSRSPTPTVDEQIVATGTSLPFDCVDPTGSGNPICGMPTPPLNFMIAVNGDMISLFVDDYPEHVHAEIMPQLFEQPLAQEDFDIPWNGEHASLSWEADVPPGNYLLTLEFSFDQKSATSMYIQPVSIVEN